MYKQNKAMKIIPPIILNNTVIEANTNAIPRYIGFRENLKIPPVTNFVACSGLNGFTVVLSFLNNNRFNLVHKINNDFYLKNF